MFELQYPVHHLEPTVHNSICVSCSNGKKHQLLELALPLKLTSQAKGTPESVITSDTDLKIKCGTFTQAAVAHVKILSDGHKAVVSHLKTQGITVYAFACDDSDEIKKEWMLKCELQGPQLAVSGRELVLSADNCSPWLRVDLTSGLTTTRLQNSRPDTDSCPCTEPVSPVSLGPGLGLVAFCHHCTGRVLLHDSRDPDLSSYISDVGENKSSWWSFASLHECSAQSTVTDPPGCLGMASNSGTLNVYDSRNWSTPCVSRDLGQSSRGRGQGQLRFKPSHSDWVSVSGLGPDVCVYQLTAQSQLQPVFVHSGHRHTGVQGLSTQTQTNTTSHSWFPTIDDLIVSSADNGTIHSWQFQDTRECAS